MAGISANLPALFGDRQDTIDPNELLKLAFQSLQPDAQQAQISPPIQQTAPSPQQVGLGDITARLGGFAGRQVGDEKVGRIGSILGGSIGNIVSDIAESRATAPVIPSGVGLTTTEQATIAQQQISREATQAQERIAEENIASQERQQRAEFVQRDTEQLKRVQAEVDLAERRSKLEERLQEQGFSLDIAKIIIEEGLPLSEADRIKTELDAARTAQIQQETRTARSLEGLTREQLLAELTKTRGLIESTAATTKETLQGTQFTAESRLVNAEQALADLARTRGQTLGETAGTAATEQATSIEAELRPSTIQQAEEEVNRLIARLDSVAQRTAERRITLPDRRKLVQAQTQAASATAKKAERGPGPKFVKVTLTKNGKKAIQYMTAEEAAKLGPIVQAEENIPVDEYVSGLVSELAELDALIPKEDGGLQGLFGGGASTRNDIEKQRIFIIKKLKIAGVDTAPFTTGRIPPSLTRTFVDNMQEGEEKEVLKRDGTRGFIRKVNGEAVGVIK